jgi:hypothetical protein
MLTPTEKSFSLKKATQLVLSEAPLVCMEFPMTWYVRLRERWSCKALL